jgi:hypothetical protein
MWRRAACLPTWGSFNLQPHDVTFALRLRLRWGGSSIGTASDPIELRDYPGGGAATLLGSSRLCAWRSRAVHAPRAVPGVQLFALIVVERSWARCCR